MMRKWTSMTVRKRWRRVERNPTFHRSPSIRFLSSGLTLGRRTMKSWRSSMKRSCSPKGSLRSTMFRL